MIGLVTLEKEERGNSLATQRLGFRTFTAEGPGSIAGPGTKISQVAWPKKRKGREGSHSVSPLPHKMYIQKKVHARTQKKRTQRR